MGNFRFLLKPHWFVLTLAIAVLVPLMIGLGFWQLDRLDERRVYNADVSAGRAADPVPLESILAVGGSRSDVDAVAWRAVSLTGSYLFEDEVFAGNQPGGRLLVLTPLELDDGSTVVVSRGLVNPPGAPRSGTQRVEVTGLLAPRPQSGPLRIELDRADPAPQESRYPGYVQLRAQSPADTAAPAPLAEPELTEGNHFSYAIQWWLFSFLAGLGWVLVVKRALREQVADQRSRPDERTGSASGDRTGVVADDRAKRVET